MVLNALLIGNGLNRAIDNNAWSDLIRSMQEYYAVEAVSNQSNLPLEFERIYLSAKSNSLIEKVSDLKNEICRRLPSVDRFELHSQYTSLPVEVILTTNYDYFLEKSIDISFCRKNCKSSTKEQKHSLFRYILCGSKKIWHIHGESHTPLSICLGYDQYCSYLSRMHEFLTKPLEGVCREPYLRHVLSSREQIQESWLPLFFTHNIHIVGLSLSFIELDLWWLLSYRMRFILENPKYKINNCIHYYYAEGRCEDDQLSLLDSMGVVLHPRTVIRDNWTRFYTDIFRDIQKNLRD